MGYSILVTITVHLNTASISYILFRDVKITPYSLIHVDSFVAPAVAPVAPKRGSAAASLSPPKAEPRPVLDLLVYAALRLTNASPPSCCAVGRLALEQTHLVTLLGRPSPLLPEHHQLTCSEG